MTETASDFIVRKSAEWERERARGKLIQMKDVNREAIHVYCRDAWAFLVQDTYAEAVNVLERLTHLETIGTPAVPMKLPAAEYRLGYFIVGRIGKAAGRWTWGQFRPDHVGRRPGAHRGEGPVRGNPAGSRSPYR